MVYTNPLSIDFLSSQCFPSQSSYQQLLPFYKVYLLRIQKYVLDLYQLQLQHSTSWFDHLNLSQQSITAQLTKNKSDKSYIYDVLQKKDLQLIN